MKRNKLNRPERPNKPERPDWEVKMGKIIFCAVVIAGLCFGQFIKPKIALCHAEPCPELVSRVVSASKLVPQGIYVKPLSQWDKLTMSNLQTHTSQFFNTTLIMQAECDSLQPKTSFWKQAGIYGLEFVGAGVGSAIPSILGLAVALYNTIDCPGSPTEGYWIYIIGNTLLSSTGSWFAGKLCSENKSWWKSAIGTAVGSGIGILVLDEWIKRPKKESFKFEGIIFFGLPPLGATIGLNL